jgi:phage gpG-like protein
VSDPRYNSAISDLLRSALHALESPTPLIDQVMREVEQVATADVKRHFVTQQDSEGKSWAAIAHSPRVNGGAMPLRDTGVLMNANSSVIDGAKLTVFNNLDYARLQNSGGTIVPVRGKFLTIPATREAKRTGSPRQFPRPLRAIVFKGGMSGLLVEKNPRKAKGDGKSDRKKAKQTKSKTKKGIQRDKGRGIVNGKFNDAVVQYYLTKHVEVPKREFMYLSEDALKTMDRIAADRLTDPILRALGMI